MFGIGFFELVLIAVAVLVFVGPQKMPEVMRQAGKLFVQFRRTANDVRGTFDQVIREAEDELRREEQAALRELLAAKAAVTNTMATTATQLSSGDHPYEDSPASGLAMTHPNDLHAPPAAPAASTTAVSAPVVQAPHPAVSSAVTHSQPATQPAPAPHPAGDAAVPATPATTVLK